MARRSTRSIGADHHQHSLAGQLDVSFMVPTEGVLGKV